MPPDLQPLRPSQPNRRLLLLQNPGRGSRHCLEGITHALQLLRINHCILQTQDIWSSNASDPASLVHRLSQLLVDQRIGAVLGYGFNGLSDIPLDPSPLPFFRSFFEVRGIPHLMLWIDHPQWHAGLTGLSPDLQSLFRSSNCIHFLKSAAHALELERILGWPNCFELPVAADPDQFPISPNAEISDSPSPKSKPEFDLVAICGEKGELPPWLLEFAQLDAPDPAAIRTILLEHVRSDLARLWKVDVPDALRPEVTALGIKWSALKAQHPFLAAHRHWPALTDEFPGAAWFLSLAYPTYMKATRILWKLREWERRFYPAYLSRYFRVGVFGGDWSPLHLGPGGWVDFLDQSNTYAKGHVALNIADGHDEEGLTLKPFEIAASGIPMLHYHATGLAEAFTPDTEIATFSTPKEAREKLDHLLDNPQARQSMARAAHTRTLTSHTWSHRIQKMFLLARLPLQNFQ